MKFQFAMNTCVLCLLAGKSIEVKLLLFKLKDMEIIVCFLVCVQAARTSIWQCACAQISADTNYCAVTRRKAVPFLCSFSFRFCFDDFWTDTGARSTGCHADGKFCRAHDNHFDWMSQKWNDNKFVQLDWGAKWCYAMVEWIKAQNKKLQPLKSLIIFDSKPQSNTAQTWNTIMPQAQQSNHSDKNNCWCSSYGNDMTMIKNHASIKKRKSTLQNTHYSVSGNSSIFGFWFCIWICSNNKQIADIMAWCMFPLNDDSFHLLSSQFYLCQHTGWRADEQKKNCSSLIEINLRCILDRNWKST